MSCQLGYTHAQNAAHAFKLGDCLFFSLLLPHFFVFLFSFTSKFGVPGDADAVLEVLSAIAAMAVHRCTAPFVLQALAPVLQPGECFSPKAQEPEPMQHVRSHQGLDGKDRWRCQVPVLVK